MGRRPKTYTFHSRKARFKVYCASVDQQQALLQHILKTEGADSLRCAIVAPVVFAEQHRPSTSAGRKSSSLLAPVLHPLAKLGRKRARTDDSGDDNASSTSVGSEDSSSDDDNNDDDDDDDSDYVECEESEGEAEGEDETEDDKDDQAESKRAFLFPYNVYLEYNTAQARSSREWGTALFEGFDKAEQLRASTPQPTSMFSEEQDNYIVDLLLTPAAVAEHGSPTLDEVATLKLVTAGYSNRADQEQVIEDIKKYCCGRTAAQSTFDRIKKRWRQAHAIPITPRAIAVVDAVQPRLVRVHPFFPHKRLDNWVERFVGPGKSLSRLVYQPLVLWSKQGRIGKTDWARSLGNHIHIRGSLDAEKIHAGILQGADVLILDNVKWHVLFNSDFGRALAEGQDSVSWIRRGGERVTTKLAVPLIILNNKKCKTWGPNNKKYWQQNLQWVRVRKVMFDCTKLIDTDMQCAAPAALPPSSSSTSSSSSSSSSPGPSSPPSSPPHEERCAPPLPHCRDLSVPVELQADIRGAVGDLRQRWPSAVPIEHEGVRLGWYLPDFLSSSEADAMLAALGPELKPHWLPRRHLTVAMRMMGKVRGVTRDKAVFSSVTPSHPSLRPIYRYDSPEYSQAVPFHEAPTVMRIRDLIVQRLNILPNHLVANLYKEQTGAKGEKPDRIGAHSDNDRDFVVGGPIVTVTLCEAGGARDVKLTRVEHTGKVAGTVSRKTGRAQRVKSVVATPPSFTAEHGSLYIINYDINHPDEEGGVWKHEIVPRRGACAGRYGLTYRCIGSFWDITTGELVNVKGKREQAVPLNIVDNNNQRVSYQGLRWGTTDTAVMEYNEVTSAAGAARTRGKRKRTANNSDSDSSEGVVVTE